LKINLKRTLILLFLIVFVTVEAIAQSEKINFKSYTINDGLSQNAVMCLLQDRYGFIWIGTEDGLNKFDGYDFISYKHDNADSTSISNNQINALYEDVDGKIWIATSKGLNIFDRKTEKFQKIIQSFSNNDGAGDFITSICKDKRGNFWLGSLADLKLYQPKENKLTIFKAFKEKANELNKVNFVFEDTDGLFWISVGKDLRRFNPITKFFLALPPILEGNQILRKSFTRVIRQDKSGKIWIGTDNNGVFLFDKKANTLNNFKNILGDNNSLPINIVREIQLLNGNEVWIGTRDGLSIYNIKDKTFKNFRNDIYDSSSLSHNSIRSILKDKTGNIWIGTYAGGVNLFTLSNNMFSSIREKIGNKNGISYRIVSSIINGDNQSILVGTEGGGLNYIDKNQSEFKNIRLSEGNTDVSANTIKSLLKDGDDIWIGAFKGLFAFNTKSNILKRLPTPENKGIYTLEKTKEGVWMGTNGAGMFLRKPDGTYRVFKNDNNNSESLCGNSITKIYKNNLGHLWIGTDRGLNYFDGKKFKQFFHHPHHQYSLSSSSILSIFIDSKKRIWIGTKGGGLNLFDAKSDRFYNISTKNGLSNDVIQSIIEDNNGDLWLSSNRGLSRIIFKNQTLPFNLNSFSIFNYYVEDGLQSNQFLPGASNINISGELFFGGINGVTFFNPDKIKKNIHKPSIVFTDFAIRNKPVNLNDEKSPLFNAINETKEIELTYDQAFITLKYAGLNYFNPNKNQYAYKLEGFSNDNDWHYVGDQKSATYTNLDAGTYLFKVKASNNDGIWNDVPRTLKIIVLPPWWKTWWANVIYVMLIGLLLYFYYYYSLKTAKLKSDLVYEHLIREKDQELYQRKLNFFTNISHEIKTPLTLILAPLEKLLLLNEGNNRVQNQLSLMKRNGERLIRLINQLLDFRKFESGNMQLKAAEGNIVRFIKEVSLAFQSYAQYLEISIKVESDKKSIKLWFDRDKFEKILYNLISNALKFTKKDGEIIIKIKEEFINDDSKELADFVVIEVIDNGIGISNLYIEKIFDQFKHYDEEGVNAAGSGIGLAFTKGLVEMHYGQITVTSSEASNLNNGYTCFTIKIPTGKAHLNQKEIITDYKTSEDIESYYDQSFNIKSNLLTESKKEKVIVKNNGDKPLMLIVEDNTDVMDFLVSHFQDKFIINQAVNGKVGLDCAISLIPDIIISDVMMPEMSGTILCSTLKNDNRTSHIPIILLTARTPLIYKIEGLETGADDYITKPFSINVVDTRVWNLLDLRQKLRDRYKKEVTLQPQNIAITSPDEIFLDKVMKFIEVNIAESTLNVEELSKEVFMSRVTLYRKIKALTGQTTIEFIRSVRLKRASQLLVTQNYSVAEVAYMVGFTDIDYFSKSFKEQYHKTPKQYGKK
jgi:signal transduction histidine kinase/ligand-binding sensor domain-containing protein/DNA-binding response OmpR family regulator